MSRCYVLCLLIVALAAMPLAADEMSVSGPVSGFVFDAGAHSLRPMVGVPGGAYLGDAIATGVDVAAVAPNGKLALAVREGRLFLISGFGAAELNWNDLGAALEGADRIAWNSRSTAAVVANSAAGSVQRLSRLDSAPEAASLPSLPGAILSLAVDAAGENVLAGVDGDGLYLLAGESSRALSRLAKPAAIALAGGDLYVANRATNEVLMIRDYTSGGDATVFANEPMGVSDPVALGLSGDGRALIVASAAGRSLGVYSLAAAGAPQRVDLDFEPSRLDRLAEKGLYVLNSGENEPLQVLDAGLAMAVYFVPAGTREE